MKKYTPEHLLGILTEVAAVLPATVTMHHPGGSTDASSLNLMVAHEDSEPRTLPVHIVSDNGAALASPEPLQSPDFRTVFRAWSTKKRGVDDRIPNYGTARVWYPNFSAVNRSAWLHCTLDTAWGGEWTGYNDLDFSVNLPAHSMRLVAEFGHPRGAALSEEGDELACRLLWTRGVRDEFEPVTIAIPDVSQPLKMTISAEAQTLWTYSYYVEHRYHRGIGQRVVPPFSRAVAPHDTYNHLKLAGLHALSQGRTEVDFSDWLSVEPIITESRELRLAVYQEQQKYRQLRYWEGL